MPHGVQAPDSAGVVMHANQLTVTAETVRGLVDGQFPRWRGLPIEEVVSHGTVNALFRLGGGLAARFPLEPGDVESIRHRVESEARAARELLGRTRFRLLNRSLSVILVPAGAGGAG